MLSVPYVIKQTPNGERGMDIGSRLLEDRIIFLTGEVNTQMAEIISAQLLYLDSIDKTPIKLYINSPGGSVSDGFAIYNTMKTIGSPVHTFCTGLAASMGAFLLSSGDKRFCLPEAEVMIHQPLGGAQGQATEIEITAKHILRTKERLNKILAKNTGKTYEEIAEATERDNWLSADEALEYGLVDEILPFTEKEVEE